MPVALTLTLFFLLAVTGSWNPGAPPDTPPPRQVQVWLPARGLGRAAVGDLPPRGGISQPHFPPAGEPGAEPAAAAGRLPPGRGPRRRGPGPDSPKTRCCPVPLVLRGLPLLRAAVGHGSPRPSGAPQKPPCRTGQLPAGSPAAAQDGTDGLPIMISPPRGRSGLTSCLKSGSCCPKSGSCCPTGTGGTQGGTLFKHSTRRGTLSRLVSWQGKRSIKGSCYSCSHFLSPQVGKIQGEPDLGPGEAAGTPPAPHAALRTKSPLYW